MPVDGDESILTWILTDFTSEFVLETYRYLSCLVTTRSHTAVRLMSERTSLCLIIYESLNVTSRRSIRERKPKHLSWKNRDFTNQNRISMVSRSRHRKTRQRQAVDNDILPPLSRKPVNLKTWKILRCLTTCSMPMMFRKILAIHPHSPPLTRLSFLRDLANRYPLVRTQPSLRHHLPTPPPECLLEEVALLC